jgi:hypothetical protein
MGGGHEGSRYSKPWLIICEGPSDKAVLAQLVRIAGVDDKFHIAHPVTENGEYPGRGGFRGLLMGVKAASTYKNIQSILIISDSDAYPDNSLKEIKAHLKDSGFPVPDGSGKPAKATGAPTVCILLIPIGKPGRLESLCIEAAYGKWTIKAPLDAFVGATPSNTWPERKQDKMRMQCIFAATCERNPQTNLKHCWSEDAQYHIPLDGPEFAAIVDFLKNYQTSLAA